MRGRWRATRVHMGGGGRRGVDGVPSTHCAQANVSACTSCTTWLRWHGEALRTHDLTCTTWLTASPRHGEGRRTTGAGCRDIGGVRLGDSVTIASHGGVLGVRRARSDSAATCQGEARRRSGVRLLRRRSGGKREREEGGCARAPCSGRRRTGEEGRGRPGRLSRAPAMASERRGERWREERGNELTSVTAATLQAGRGSDGGSWRGRGEKAGRREKKLRVGRLLYRNFAWSVWEETQCVLASWRVGPTGRRRQERNRLHARSRWAR
jgi:hypothetical protein